MRNGHHTHTHTVVTMTAKKREEKTNYMFGKWSVKIFKRVNEHNTAHTQHTHLLFIRFGDYYVMYKASANGHFITRCIQNFTQILIVYYFRDFGLNSFSHNTLK